MSSIRLGRTNELLIMVILSAGILSACASSRPVAEEFGQVVPVETGGSYVDITPAELKEMLDDKDFFFVNVHIPYEGEIADTDAHVPFDQVREQLSRFPENRDAKIVVYCRSGSMSAIAARTLVEEGYTEVLNLDGGFRAWKASGYPYSE